MDKIIKFLEEEIAELQAYIHDDNYSDLEVHDLNVSIKECRQILNYVKKIEMEDKKIEYCNCKSTIWHSVNEKLPEKNGKYLILRKVNKTKDGKYNLYPTLAIFSIKENLFFADGIGLYPQDIVCWGKMPDFKK